jgi:hypothetical protein
MITILMPVKDGLDAFLLSLGSLLRLGSQIRKICVLDSSDVPLVSQSPIVGELFAAFGAMEVKISYTVLNKPIVGARIALLKELLDDPKSEVGAFIDSDIVLKGSSCFTKVLNKYFYKTPSEYGFVSSLVESPTNIAGYDNFVTTRDTVKNPWHFQFCPVKPMEVQVKTSGLFCCLFHKSSITEELLYVMNNITVREDMLFTRYLSLNHKKEGVIDYADLQVYHFGKTRKKEWDTKAFDRDQTMFDRITDYHALQTLSQIY